MSDKQLPDDPAEFARFLRQRCAGQSPGYDIAIYARPSTWLALANALDPPQTADDRHCRDVFEENVKHGGMP